MTIRKRYLLSLSLSLVVFLPLALAQHTSLDLDPKIAPYVTLASELTSRSRANVYFPNPQGIFHGVQVNDVNVGRGNLTFLRRDLVASGRIPIMAARVYDSSASGNGDFGPGWLLSAAETISIENHTAKLLSENDTVIEFTEGEDGTFKLTKDGRFAPTQASYRLHQRIQARGQEFSFGQSHRQKRQ